MKKLAATEAACFAAARNASSTTNAESRCKLTLEKSKRYWALIACKHCREYTTCRSVFTCFSKVAHHREVVLVDGKEARDKVAILSEGQPRVPSTEGRKMGEIEELELRLVEAGVACTVGCTECAGLPLKECIDAGHYQQERFTEDLPAMAKRRAQATLRSGLRISKQSAAASKKTSRREEGDVNARRKRSRLCISQRKSVAAPATAAANAKAARSAKTPPTKHAVTTSAKPAVTPLLNPAGEHSAKVSPLSSSKPAVTPSSRPVVTPPAKYSHTPPSKRAATPSTKPSVTPQSDPAVGHSAKVSPLSSSKPSVTPLAKPAVTPSAKPTVTPPSEPTVARSQNLSIVAIQGKNYVLPVCVCVKRNSFELVIAWQAGEFLVNGVLCRGGRMRFNLPWAGGVTAENLSKTRALRDTIWWHKTSTVHPLVAAKIANDSAADILYSAKLDSVVRVILCRRGRDGRAPVFATTKRELGKSNKEQQARLFQLMSSISEAYTTSDDHSGSLPEKTGTAASSTSTASTACKPSTVSRTVPYKRRVAGSRGNDGSAGEHASRSKRLRSGGGVSPGTDDRSRGTACHDENRNPIPPKKSRAVERSDVRPDVVSQDNLESGEVNARGTAAPVVVEESPPVLSCVEDADVPVESDNDREQGLEAKVSARGRGIGFAAEKEQTSVEGNPVDTMEGGDCTEGVGGTRVPVAETSASVSSEKGVIDRYPARSLLSPASSAPELNEANEARPVPRDTASAAISDGTVLRAVSEMPVPSRDADGGRVAEDQGVDGAAAAVVSEPGRQEQVLLLMAAKRDGPGSSANDLSSKGKQSALQGGNGSNGVTAREWSESKTESRAGKDLGMRVSSSDGAVLRAVSEMPAPSTKADGGRVAEDEAGGAAAASESSRQEHMLLTAAKEDEPGSSSNELSSNGKEGTLMGGNAGSDEGNSVTAGEESESKTEGRVGEDLSIEYARAFELARFKERQRRELSEEKRQCREELAPLEAELEALKRRLRVRMRAVIERQAQELDIYHAALYGASGRAAPHPSL